MKDKAALGRIICIYLKINILYYYYTSVIIYFLNITESTFFTLPMFLKK